MQTPPEPSTAADGLLCFELIRDPLRELPILQIKGKLTDEGWSRIAGATSRMSGPLKVLDFSGITHCQTTSDDAASFGRQLARQKVGPEDTNCHVLVAPGDLLFGLCRVVQVNLDMAGIQAAVFRSVTTATRWLEQENLVAPTRGAISEASKVQTKAPAQDSTHSLTSPGPR